MTDIPFALDPEVEALLREVAQDPHSTLLRVERPKAIRGLFEREPVVGVAMAGLTTAERHLVQTKRAEVAYALRVLVTHTLMIDPRGEHSFSAEGVPAYGDRLAQLDALRHRLGLGSQSADYDGRKGLELLHASGQKAAQPQAPVLATCAIAQRLEPTDNSRLHAAHWLILENQLQSALAVLTNVLQYPTQRIAHTRTLTTLAYVQHRVGNLETSLGYYRAASQADDYYAAAIGSQFVVAAQLGHESELKRAARLLDVGWDAESTDMIWIRQAHRARRPEVLAHFSIHGQRLLANIKAQLGPTSRSLADVLV